MVLLLSLPFFVAGLQRKNGTIPMKKKIERKLNNVILFITTELCVLFNIFLRIFIVFLVHIYFLIKVVENFFSVFVILISMSKLVKNVTQSVV